MNKNKIIVYENGEVEIKVSLDNLIRTNSRWFIVNGRNYERIIF